MHPFFYDIIYTVMFIFYLPLFLGKSLIKKKSFAKVQERFGIIKVIEKKEGTRIWIHAVSVGEFLSIKKLIGTLKKTVPGIIIYISTVTPAAYSLANKIVDERCSVFYFPFDWSFTVKRVLNKIHPDLIVLMESEFWPNFLYYCSKMNITIMTANGRISERAFQGYSILKTFFASRLESIKLFCMQSKADAERLSQLGIDSSRIKIVGNMKYDVEPPTNSSAKEQLSEWLKENQCIIAGSTMKGEEELLLELFIKLKKEYNTLKLIIAPRHLDRFNEVAHIIEGKGLTYCRRTAGQIKDTDVFLLDTIGELASIHALATIVIVGGSILSFGGHNIIEPAYFKKPIIIGEHMENFSEVTAHFLQQQACIQIPYNDFYERLTLLLKDTEERGRLGNNAFNVVQQNLGATEKVYGYVLEMLTRNS
ncbi:MAG: hypothetical protein A2Y62_00555 [Candidatus Fischerbacteria bacterium RBG_13_37_8]|uniref:3-deoxy-D-manno-octulosonic acid transferase n=1 Tax=Candidatus Fischerbacteria bacterium RBG_13_37_8 TaxID=1817863 RepID=A0A1F5VMG5_9BACT|nr:MAG: hypothetical protein A2Y62_00555 [Candidatus Fischerbacteria bacterium RBG_13_37_8]